MYFFMSVRGRPASAGVLAEVREASRQVANEAQEQVHCARLGVPPGLPPGERVHAQAQDARQLALGQAVAPADGPDLVGGSTLRQARGYAGVASSI